MHKKSKIATIIDNKSFNSKYGAFFEEFKDSHTSNRLFYFFFITRRILMVFVILIFDSPIVQLQISLIPALAVTNI
jgi:hypothetical protein